MKPWVENALVISTQFAIVAALVLPPYLSRDGGEDVAPRGKGNLENRLVAMQIRANDDPSQENKYALLVTGHATEPRLRASINHSRDVLGRYGFTPENTLILDNRGEPQAYPVDGPASKEAFSYVLEGLQQVVDSNDTLVIYYDGHGGRVDNLSTLSLPGLDINQREFIDYISNIHPAQGLAFIGACYSGGFNQEFLTRGLPEYSFITTSFPESPISIFGDTFLYRFNDSLCEQEGKNPSISKAFQGMLEKTFPTVMARNEKARERMPFKLSLGRDSVF